MGLFDGVGGLFGGVGGLLGGVTNALFGGGKEDYNNPADSASPYYNKVAPTITPYYQPYIDQGKSGMKNYNDVTQRMLMDPGAFYNNIMAGYQRSPGYEFNKQEALGAGDNAAAAGGMAGSPEHQENNMRLAEALSNNDIMQYLQTILGINTQGLEGQGNIAKTGYMASTGLADELAAALMNQGNLAYTGTQNENQFNQQNKENNMDFWGGLAGAFGGSQMGSKLSGIISGWL